MLKTKQSTGYRASYAVWSPDPNQNNTSDGGCSYISGSSIGSRSQGVLGWGIIFISIIVVIFLKRYGAIRLHLK